jgi:hypothetical protein
MATTSYFDKVRLDNNIAARTNASHRWFAQKVKSLGGNIKAMDMLKDPHFLKKTSFKPGFMYHFIYDAKNKETLPHWDKFPLMLAVGPAPGGFYGLNLHYLYPQARAKFLDKLIENTNNDKWDETTRIRLNYNMLSSVSKLKAFAPCFKHYLFEHVKSRIMLVPSSDWELALFLPTENFVGDKKRNVWKQSKNSITG